MDSDAKTDGSEAVQLYSDAGTTGVGIYVKIYTSAPTYNVKLSIQDSETIPIQDATVVIGETTRTTGSAGGCSFTLDMGTYSVEVSKKGYTTKTESIDVDPSNLQFVIVLASA